MPSILQRAKYWIPLAKPSPLSSFAGRSLRKFLSTYGIFLRLTGARPTGIHANGNTLLKLNNDCPLGKKGTVIQLPKDKILYSSVRNTGQWAIEESVFLAEGLGAIPTRVDNKSVLIDIGANTGLITLQAMNLAQSKNDIVLFEPLKRHAEAIEFNLAPVSKNNNIIINKFALSDRAGVATFFSEKSNFGNSSLLCAVVPDSDVEMNTVDMVETGQYFERHLSHYTHCVLKCDAQGYDALILSRIPDSIWASIERAIIEIWAIAEIQEQDVDKLLAKLQQFECVSWHPSSFDKIEQKELREFWLAKSGESRNLYLCRSRTTASQR